VLKEKIKVLQIIGGGEFGGAEQHIILLLEQFTQYSFIEAEVITFYDSLFSHKLKELGYKVTVIEEGRRFNLKQAEKLAQFFKDYQPDILHSHGVRANFFTRIAAQKAGVKNVITTVHSFLRNDYPNALNYLIMLFLEKSTAHLNKHYIAVSKSLYEHLLRSNIPQSKLSLIYNGINLTKFTNLVKLAEDKIKLKEKLEIPVQAKVIGTVARLVPVKGLDYLLAGFQLALAKEKNLYLVIVGDGSERGRLVNLAIKSGIEKNVKFVGFQNDIPAWLNLFDIYINTSLSEGQPISLLEAFALAKPAIVSQVGGIVEMVHDRLNGLFIPPQDVTKIGEAILELIRDDELARKIGENAKKTCETSYSSSVMGAKVVELYQKLLHTS